MANTTPHADQRRSPSFATIMWAVAVGILVAAACIYAVHWFSQTGSQLDCANEQANNATEGLPTEPCPGD